MEFPKKVTLLIFCSLILLFQTVHTQVTLKSPMKANGDIQPSFLKKTGNDLIIGGLSENTLQLNGKNYKAGNNQYIAGFSRLSINDQQKWRSSKPLNASISSITNVQNQNFWVFGQFSDTLKWNGLSQATSPGGEGLFLGRINSTTGNLKKLNKIVEAKKDSGGFNYFSSPLAQNANGSIYILTAFYGRIHIADTTIEEEGQGINDVLLIKYSPSTQKVEKFIKFGGSFHNLTDLSTEQNKIYAALSYRGKALIGRDTLSNSGARLDALLVEFDNNLKINNFYRGKGTGNQYFSDIQLQQDTLLITGNFRGSMEIGNELFIGQGKTSGFFTKITPKGQVISKAILYGRDRVTLYEAYQANNAFWLAGSFTDNLILNSHDTLSLSSLNTQSGEVLIKLSSNFNVSGYLPLKTKDNVGIGLLSQKSQDGKILIGGKFSHSVSIKGETIDLNGTSFKEGLFYATINQNEFQETGIKRVRKSRNYLKIYPNPAIYQVHLLNQSKFPINSRIFNSQGKFIKSLNLERGEKSTLRDLKPGTYFIKTRSRQGSKTFKFIKM